MKYHKKKSLKEGPVEDFTNSFYGKRFRQGSHYYEIVDIDDEEGIITFHEYQWPDSETQTLYIQTFLKRIESGRYVMLTDDLNNLTQIKPWDIKMGDIIMVDGYDNLSGRSISKEIGTVISVRSEDEEDDDGVAYDGFTILFSPTFKGHSGDGNTKCRKDNCWTFFDESYGESNINDFRYFINNDGIDIDIDNIFESTDDFGWVTDIIDDIESNIVEVVRPHSRYPCYLEAMSYLDVKGIKSMMKKLGIPEGEFQLIYDTPTYGEYVNLESLLKDFVPNLVKPNEGDLCYVYPKVFKKHGTELYKLTRISDGGEFIMNKFGFVPVDNDTLLESELDDYSWVTDVVIKEAKVSNVGKSYPTYLEAMIYLDLDGVRPMMTELGISDPDEIYDTSTFIDFESEGLDDDGNDSRRDTIREFIEMYCPKLIVPNVGDLCYVYPKTFNTAHDTIHKLVRISDGGEFLIGSKGFVLIK